MVDKRFECIEEIILHEQNETRACLYRHKATGAQIVSCSNTDTNKVFGVTFRTPPKSSTGVPHILEHSVLCGSKKYPVKEPFVVLLKSSLQTFLNAFTYPDKTCYPVASTNLRDFYNLIDVYLDAVFYPRITEDIFKQEGWHVEANSVDEPLQFTGVVYNEMKGVYSSADSYLAEKTQHSVFPDTIYSVDSGGEPTIIRTLTYEDFRAFHKQYYHPSNARFFFWGDDPVEHRFAILGDLLDSYTQINPQSSIALQQPYTPQTYSYPYGSSQTEKACMVTFNWLLPQTTDIIHNFAFEVLEFILLGMPGSPLRKALIESQLGTDITGGGLHSELQQMYFSVGLKGIEKDSVKAVEDCIFSTLQKLVTEGIPQELIDAALTSIEFSLRENNTERFPVGLALMVRSLTTWLYDASPFSLLAFEKPLEYLKQQGSSFYTKLIEDYFLQNSSRTQVLLYPDTTIEQQQREQEEAALQAIASKLSPQEKAVLVEETKAFLERQAKPDSEEALATIPTLKLSDISKKGKEYPLIYKEGRAISVVATAGILYMDMYFSLESVPEDLYPLLPLFARVMTEMGTEKQDYTQLGIAISCKTGDIDFSTASFVERHTRRFKPYFFAEMKVLKEKAQAALPLLIEILLEPRLQNKERFTQIVKEEKARLEQAVIPSGHTFALSRLGAQYTETGVWGERLAGFSYLQFLKVLLERIEKDWESVLHDCTILHNAIIKQGKYATHISCDEQSIVVAQEIFGTIQQVFPNMVDIDDISINLTTLPRKNEAFITQSQVQYMAKAVNMYEHGIEYHGAFAVACKYLRMGYLWERVRVQGGAYGAFISCNKVTGMLAMASYRDPCAKQTLTVFDEAVKHLKEHVFSQQELDRLIIATIGDIDSYLLPDAQGRLAMAQYISHSTQEERQKTREQILATTASDIRTMIPALEAFTQKGTVVALGGATLESALQDDTTYSVERLIL